MIKIRNGMLMAALSLIAATAGAQNYPTRPITMIVPFAAGGPTDTLARQLAVAMLKNIKQNVIVENVAGAGGNIGATRVARANPDGYTVLLHHIGMATSPALYRKMEFNPLTDFEYLGLVADVPMTLIARNNFPPNNFKEFLGYVKENKAKLQLANAGLGAASHLCGLMLMSAMDTEVLTVPYGGTGPAMIGLMGGQVDFMCDQTTNTTPQILAGKVKVYGVTTKTRVPVLPSVPTLDEQGMKGFEVLVWHGLYAPKKTPRPVLDALQKSMQEGLKDPELKAQLAKLGAEPTAVALQNPESLRKFLASEIDKWGPVIRKAGQFAD